MDPVKSSIDRRLVRAGKLPIAIKTKKNIKKTRNKRKDAIRKNYYKKKGKQHVERKKERYRKKILFDV